MRRRVLIVSLLVVALVLSASAIAIAGKRFFVSKPFVTSRKVQLNKEFKVKGYVYPSSVATDGVSSLAIRVLKLTGAKKPRWSQIATVPATFGKVVKKRFVSYEASVTIVDPGFYRLRAALVQTDTIVAQSEHRPLCFPKPKPAPHKAHGKGHCKK
jgi:hypothetical protein